MQEDWHTIGTANEKSVLAMFGTERTMIALRRATDPTIKCALREYAMNRRNESAPWALENLVRVLGRGQ